MDLVACLRNGGCLYQGDARDSLDVNLLDRARIKAVVFAARQNNDTHLPDRFDVLRAKLEDNPFAGRVDTTHFWNAANGISDLLVEYLQSGENVLSTCMRGWNRSGLVSAFTLVKLGMSAGQAIEAVRRARGRDALWNPVFQRLIHKLGRDLGR